MQTEQPCHHPVWSPGSNPVRGCLSIECPSKSNRFFSPADSESAAFEFFPELQIGGAEKYRTFQIPASIHRQPLTGFNKPSNPCHCTLLHAIARLPDIHSLPSPPSCHRGKSRLIAVNRAKKISLRIFRTARSAGVLTRSNVNRITGFGRFEAASAFPGLLRVRTLALRLCGA